MPAQRSLRFEPIVWEDCYEQPSPSAIQEALRVVEPANTKKAKASGKKDAAIEIFPEHTFPAPLVEEGDEIYHDPEYLAQSVQEWVEEEERNEVTPERRTIYVVPPPEITDEVAFMREWESPSPPSERDVAGARKDQNLPTSVAAHPPQVEELAEYLRAFYHGLPVKVLDRSLLNFVRWKRPKQQTKRARAPSVGLATGREAIAVRYRASPDEIFPCQLNLNDLLDVAMEILPADAYTVLMLVHQDMYEDEDDDFCCGRAYGGSRIAVVSTARYRPELDRRQNVDRERCWPASHCAPPVRPPAKKSVQGKTYSDLYPGSAIAASVDAFQHLPVPANDAALATLWLSRVCKTASHELGHCFGIDHCMYFACLMQGTANMPEDSRQPPYLCPVDGAKLLKVTGSDVREHLTALYGYCERHCEDRMFGAFRAWIEVRLKQLVSSR